MGCKEIGMESGLITWARAREERLLLANWMGMGTMIGHELVPAGMQAQREMTGEGSICR